MSDLKRNILCSVLLTSVFSNSVCAGLMSELSENESSLISSHNTEDSLLLSNTANETESENNKQNNNVLISDTEITLEDIINYNYSNIEELNADEILRKLDLTASSEVYYYDYVIKNYTYRNDMAEVCKKINDDAISVIDRYIQKTKYIPLKDPLWFLAIGAVEYNSGEYGNKDIICSWPVNIEDYQNNPKYMLGYNWRNVEKYLGTEAVTRRTGGAIGPFQLENFFGKGVSPVIPEEFGIIGSSQQRTDCWVDLGSCVASGSSIIWQQGTYADRWNIADSANLCFGVYDTTLKKVGGKCALTELESKYEQAVFLMWAHNRGTGILGNNKYKEKVQKICGYIDEIMEIIYKIKPYRFTRRAEFKDIAEKIGAEVNCDVYPIYSLISYLIVEARYTGAW